LRKEKNTIKIRNQKKEKGKIMNFEDKIKELKIELPEAKPPVGNYVATKIVENLLYVSGQVSINSNGELIKGKVGKDLTTDEAYKAAERCGISIISQVKKACEGDLSKVKSCIKLTGFVNSTDDYTEQPKVINGASDLIASIFGDAGMHTRAAVSTNSLPLGVSVEVDAIFELN
jgi:enamine deaminase RidA (YjgF/YER057c/UK114 family)